jgi:hypothetical protein
MAFINETTFATIQLLLVITFGFSYKRRRELVRFCCALAYSLEGLFLAAT